MLLRLLGLILFYTNELNDLYDIVLIIYLLQCSICACDSHSNLKHYFVRCTKCCVIRKNMEWVKFLEYCILKNSMGKRLKKKIKILKKIVIARARKEIATSKLSWNILLSRCYHDVVSRIKIVYWMRKSFI